MTTPGKPVFGAGILRYPALESPNFVTGTSGWIVRQDGSAEFNNIAIRNGSVTGGTALYYTQATPALGKLDASIAGSAGVDTAGNHYLPGVFSYLTSPGGTHSALAWGLDTQFASFSFYKWSGTAWVVQSQVLVSGASDQGMLLSSVIPVTFNSGISISGGGLLVSGGVGVTISSGGLLVTGGTTTDTLIATGASTLHATTIPSGGLAVTGGTATDTLTATGKVTATGGTAAAPTLITTDTWNTLGALAAGSGYSVNNGRFQLTTDGRVEVDVNLTAGAATVAGNYAFANALPVGQRPPFQCSYPLGFNGTTAAGVNTPTLRVSTAGGVTLQLPALPNTTVVSATQRIPTN